MQSLDTFEAMTAVTHEFLQHNAQYQAGVTVSPNNKRGPDDMEIDALTRKGKSHKYKGKSKTDGQRLLVQGQEQRWTAQQQRKEKGKAKAKEKESTG